MCREGSRLDTLRATSTGSNALFIDAHALARDAFVVTEDVRELSRGRGLRVENWLEGGGGSP
jgi:predicted nucleic acid-binding protein